MVRREIVLEPVDPHWSQVVPDVFLTTRLDVSMTLRRNMETGEVWLSWISRNDVDVYLIGEDGKRRKLEVRQWWEHSGQI